MQEISILQTDETPLHVAAHAGHMDIIETLITAGCNPCIKNKVG